MNTEKPNFLSQPVVKNIFVYRNGDPYYEARRVVVNHKRMSNFETFLREVTGGVQAPFGAVRNIYTPKAGHRVDSLEHLQSGEQYVAAGKEKFKKLDYQQIGPRKRRLLQSVVGQVKPVPQSRIIVSARFLKPIKEPCAIFVVANGDVLNPAVRLLIPQRVLGQYERVLEMITEKMSLRILGGVRSLYTFDGALVNVGKDLENGQFYVAVGREKFKRLPYSDLLFTKPRGMRRTLGSKAASLPPIYRFSKQNGTSKSLAACSDGGDSKTSPPGNKEHLSSIVREISQARLVSLRKKRSGMSMSLGVPDNDEADQRGEEGHVEPGNKTPQDLPVEESPAEDLSDEKPPEEAQERDVEAAKGEDTTEEATGAGEKEDQVAGSDGAPQEGEKAGPGETTEGGGEEEQEEDKAGAGSPTEQTEEAAEAAEDGDVPHTKDGEEENKNLSPAEVTDEKEEKDEPESQVDSTQENGVAGEGEEGTGEGTSEEREGGAERGGEEEEGDNSASCKDAKMEESEEVGDGPAEEKNGGREKDGDVDGKAEK